MESLIIPIHVLINILFGLYLLIRLIISVVGHYRKKELLKTRRVLKKVEISFLLIILVLGLYPLIALQYFKIYHLIKLLLFASLLLISIFYHQIKFLRESIILIAVFALAFFISIVKPPVISSKYSRPAQALEGVSMQAKGKAIFKIHCVQCHGEDGKKGLFQAADLSLTKLSKEQKIHTITNGVPLTVMRAFKHDLTAEDIENVVTYVELLKE